MTHILFDLDGTLVDSQAGIRQCFVKTFEQMGLPPPNPNDVPIGPPILKTLKTYLGAKHETRYEEARKKYQELYDREGVLITEPYDGIEEVLQELSVKFHCYVVTSKAEKFARKMIETLGWSQFFKEVYGSGLNGELMDKSDLIAHVLSVEHLASQQCVMIGDRYHDLEGAANNSIKSIGVLWGYGATAELQPHRPLFLAPTVSELYAFVLTL